MNARKFGFWVVILALLVPAGTALAKEVGALTITGPGITTPIVLTDRATLLEQTENLYHYTAPLKGQPAWIAADSPYFELARDYMDGDKVIATDRLRYYPAPEGDKSIASAIQYVGMDDPGFSDQAGKWFNATPSGQKWLNGVLAKAGVDVAAVASKGQTQAQPVAKPVAAQQAAPVAAAPAAPEFPMSLIAAVVAALIVAVGAGAWLVRSRLALRRA